MVLRRSVGRIVMLTMSLALLIVPGTSAFAAYPGGGETPPVVKGEKFFRGGTANTGSDVLLFVVLALVFLVIGAVAYRASKRGAGREI